MPGEQLLHDPLSEALRALRNQSFAAPLGQQLAGTLRNGMLNAIRRELGEQVGDMAVQSMQGKPVTVRNVERILQAALRLSAARKAALASVAHAPSEYAMSPPPATLADRPGSVRTNGSAGAAGGRPGRPAEKGLPAARLDELIEPFLQGRHPVLLRHCAELLDTGLGSHADGRSVGERAARLHDHVRAFLDKQGRWPIRTAAEYERHARPAAVVLAAWDTAISLEDP